MKIQDKIGRRIEDELTTYVVVDIETTGLNHFNDEIIEIGAIKYNSGKEVNRFNVLLKSDRVIPKSVEKITGITNEMIQDKGMNQNIAIDSFRDFIGDYIVVGHNFTSFDSKFLDDAYVKELNCHFSNDYIDTLYLSKKVLPELKSHSLESLSKEYNVDYSKAHRAIEDCEINHFIYEYLTFGHILDNSKENNKNDNEDDFVEVKELKGWKARLSEKFSDLINEYELYENTINILANMGKDGKVSSYAICIYEPDLVEDKRNGSKNTVVARIKENILKSNPDLVEVYSKNVRLEKYDNISKDNSGNFCKRFEMNSNEFIECLIDCIRYGIENYVPKASGFACCARYEECSTVGRCIHPNVLYAKACKYRTNLEQGNVFLK